MAYRRRKRSGTKGRKCVRRKRVHVRGQGMALRCVKYGPKRKRTTKRRRKTAKRRHYKGTRRYSKRGARHYRPRSGGQPVMGPFTSSGHFY